MIVILVPALFYYIRGELKFLPNDLHYVFNIQPATVILGHNTMYAIDIFSGNSPVDYSWSWRSVSMYLNVVLYLMLGPYLFLMGYKKAKHQENRPKPWYWYVGASLCIGSLLIIPSEIMKQKVLANTKTSAAESRQRDMMRTELAEVGFALAQYEILEDGIDESFQVEDLNLEGLKFQYTVESVQFDTLITLVGSIPDQPEVTVTMEVRPYNQSVIKQRN